MTEAADRAVLRYGEFSDVSMSIVKRYIAVLLQTI
jgi:hypothetical protein